MQNYNSFQMYEFINFIVENDEYFSDIELNENNH